MAILFIFGTISSESVAHFSKRCSSELSQLVQVMKGNKSLTRRTHKLAGTTKKFTLDPLGKSFDGAHFYFYVREEPILIRIPSVGHSSAVPLIELDEPISGSCFGVCGLFLLRQFEQMGHTFDVPLDTNTLLQIQRENDVSFFEKAKISHAKISINGDSDPTIESSVEQVRAHLKLGLSAIITLDVDSKRSEPHPVGLIDVTEDKVESKIITHEFMSAWDPAKFSKDEQTYVSNAPIGIIGQVVTDLKTGQTIGILNEKFQTLRVKIGHARVLTKLMPDGRAIMLDPQSRRPLPVSIEDLVRESQAIYLIGEASLLSTPRKMILRQDSSSGPQKSRLSRSRWND